LQMFVSSTLSRRGP